MPNSLETYKLLESIAQAEIDDLSFPTHFHIALKLRTALGDADVPFKKVSDLLKGEPLMSAKIIAAANSSASRTSEKITNVETAVFRLGLATVRRIALGIAMIQLNKSKEMLAFANLSRSVWLNSLYTSASAYVVAKETSGVHAEEAEFAGLLLNIGAFYMLYQVSTVKDKVLFQEDVREGIARNYLSLTKRLLTYLDVPTEIQEAMDIEPLRKLEMKHPPKSLREVLHIANELGTKKHPWFEEDRNRAEITQPYVDLSEAIQDRYVAAQQTYR